MQSQKRALNPTKHLSEAEFESLETMLKRHLSTKYRRDALVIAVALRSGGRAGEILNLTSKDFCPDTKTIFLKGLKGSNDRSVPLPEWIIRGLASHLRHVQHGERIFGFSYSRLRQIWQDYRPSKKPFHSLRHTFAVKTYQFTKDIRLLQTVLGHRSVMNTIIYVDYVYSIKETRKIIF